MKKVVSLFNGMSVAAMAFEDVGIDVQIFHSEVDKHANKVTEVLFPDSVPLGDVRFVDGNSFDGVDYLVGGSPCQSFSFSGKQEGMVTDTKEEILTLEHYLQLKSEGFKFKGQSYLFWEFVRVLSDLRVNNPDVKFLLENVVMSKKWENVITTTLGVAPVLINSDLVSGQQRKRLYWTNINNGDISQPEDLGINFRDLLEEDKFTNSAARSGRYVNKATIVGRRLNENGCREDYNKSVPITQCIEVRKTNTDKVNCLTTVQKDNIITSLPVGRHVGAFTDYTKDVDWRYLTAREALRMQTIPEHYIDKMLEVVSENQAYKMAGNGWTMKIISYILKH
jgi:DNA (cytosine-5)-methyltransferase 3A